MADIEKVIRGLECCTSAKHPISCDKCDYFGNDEYNDFWSCRISLMRDALAILKVKEPVKPVIKPIAAKDSTNCTQWYACRNCGASIDPDDKYCRRCGRAVKWDD